MQDEVTYMMDELTALKEFDVSKKRVEKKVDERVEEFYSHQQYNGN